MNKKNMCVDGSENCGKLDCAWGCSHPRDTSSVVPTAVVPRISTSGWAQRVDAAVPLRVPTDEAIDPVAKAVDDYLLMERKARAWDALFQELSGEDEGASTRVLAVRMQQLLAQVGAPDTLK